ncbi:hypothetical protein Tco_0876921, partial [Tanacetum coccineum]
TKKQVCLLCEVILKQIPAFNFYCASLESIIAIENTWEWEKVWEDIPTLYLGFVWAGKMEFGMTDLQLDVSRNGWFLSSIAGIVVVIGSQALSVALDICRGRVEKMERNLVERLPLLKDVFVSLDHPLSVEALIEPSVVVPATNFYLPLVMFPILDLLSL